MSRNGPFVQPRAPQRRPAEHDPYAAPGGPNGQWPQHNGNGYTDPNYNNGAQPGYAPQQQGQGYHYPQAEPDPHYYPQQGHAPQDYPQQGQGYDRYQAPAAPIQTAGYPAQNGQWGQQDPRNYDLGSYMPNGAPAYAPPEPQHFQPQHAPAEPYGGPQQQYAEPEAEYDDAMLDEDEPRSGRRWLVIVAALVGAIGLGGGMAYTYKMLFTSGSNRAPIVKAIDFPNKVKAATGKENATVDKKLFTRLGEDAPDARPGAAAADSDTQAQDDRPADNATGGPRPVRLIPIAPNGQGPGGTTGNTNANAKPVVTVPGLMIDTSGGPRNSGAAFPANGGQASSGAAGRPNVTVQTNTNASATADPVTPQRKVAVVVPNTNANTNTNSTNTAKVAVPRAKEASTASAGAATSSNGYVAVLSSQKSRMDAMKAYASIDQKYRDMLASSTFDVQEADLGEKGVWYRAVVGPPRSFDGAKKICEELKSAGYPSCWPAKY